MKLETFYKMQEERTTYWQFPWGKVTVLHCDEAWDRFANMRQSPLERGYETSIDFVDGCSGSGRQCLTKESLAAYRIHLVKMTPAIMEAIAIREEVSAQIKPLHARASVAADSMFAATK